MTQNDEWLPTYYSKVQSEYQISFNKKDQLTNWSLTVLLAMFASYFGLLDIVKTQTDWYRFALLIGTLIILIQFFVNSFLAYGFLKKWRVIKENIESYWISSDPNLLNKVILNIQTYDHGRRMNTTIKDMIWSQLRAGFLVVLSAPLFLLLLEIKKISVWSNEHSYTIIIFIIFLIWQIISVLGYDQSKFYKKIQNT